MNVGVTYDVHSAYRNQIPAIATRTLKPTHTFQFQSPETRMFFQTKSYIVKYVYGFSSSIFSYFMTIQLTHSSLNATQEYVSKLVRICQRDEHYYSYTEIPIECMKNGNRYNLVQAAYLSKPTGGKVNTDENDDVLYAIFSHGINGIPSNRSGLCTYTMASIEEKFRENIQTCFNGVGSTGLDFISPSKPCDNIYIKISKNFCDSFRNSPLGGEQSIAAESLATFDEHSIAAATVAQFDRNSLLLIGTADGRLKRLTIQSDSNVIQNADMRIFENSPINAMQLDLQQSSLYVLSDDQLAKVHLYDNCTVFPTCDECVGAKNVYCGWCPRESRCTLEMNCFDEFNSSVSWKNYVSLQFCYLD